MIDYIKSDLYRYTGGGGLKSFLKHYFFHRGFNFSFWFRCVSRGNVFIRLLALPIFWYKSMKYGLRIPHQTQIGYGLYIGHGGPVIINRSTRIGNNVNLSQFTTIGSNNGQAAIIGDNVYIGPNVCIVEDVMIGDNATIGAGSVVTKDIPANATAAGNYAKVLNYNNPGRYINNVWEVK